MTHPLHFEPSGRTGLRLDVSCGYLCGWHNYILKYGRWAIREHMRSIAIQQLKEHLKGCPKNPAGETGWHQPSLVR